MVAPETPESVDPAQAGDTETSSMPPNLPPSMAKYFQEPPSLASYENASTSRWSFGSSSTPKLPVSSVEPTPVAVPPATATGEQVRPVKKGMKQRSLHESWARGLMLMGAGLGFFALLNTGSSLALNTGLERPVLAWVGAGLVVLAGRKATAVLLEDPPYTGPYYRPGGALMVAGLALVFLGPWVVTALS